MHGFRVWMENQQNDLIASAKAEAERMVEKPNPRFKNGFGQLSEIEELAAVINSAKNGYPEGSKRNAAVIFVHMPFFQDHTHPAYWLLQMITKYKIPSDQYETGSYNFGPDAKRISELLTLQSKHYQDYKHWEYAKEIGRLLGYSDAAIDAYIARGKDLRDRKTVTSIQDMKAKEF